MNTAASIIDQYIKIWLQKIVLDCKGDEHKALMELIRSTDLHAVLLQIGNSVGPAPYGIPRDYSNVIQKGIAMLLDAFLPKIDSQVNKLDLGNIQLRAIAWADEVLCQAGELSNIRRLAYLERQKAVKCEVESDKAITIIIKNKDWESLEKEDEYAVLDHIREQQREDRDRIEEEVAEWLMRPINEYVSTDDCGIQEIKFNEPLFRIFERQAQLQINEYAEADLFPDDVIIGERTFGNWKQIAATLTALSHLHHFYSIKTWKSLPEPMQHLGTLRHILPAVYHNDELIKRWRQILELSGIESPENIESSFFILASKDARDCAAKNDHPSPLGINIGGLTVLPQFGYIGNSFSFLVNNLERLYPASWAAGKERREAGFQADLSALFSSANYTTGYTNINIRRIDGSISTDIDAVLYEHSESCVYLVQLKWPSSYTTPNQRSSRIKNLGDANDWIKKVSEWRARVNNLDILRLFGLHNAQCDIESMRVRLIVLSRSWTRFGGEVNQDPRAAWISWSRLRHLCLENHETEDPLNVAWTVAIQGDDCTYTPRGHTRTLNFEDLKVSICT